MANGPERLLFIGGWGHHYLEAVVGATGPSVAFAADGVDEMAKLRADATADARWFADPEEALSEFEPDLVSIGGVYGRNGTLLRMVVDRGIPAVCDKPIATDLAQLDELSGLIESRAATVLTELPLRCDAAMRSARAAVADGRIGEPVLVNAQKSYKWGGWRPEWYGDPDLYAGTVLWIATHGLDLVGYVTGQSATALSGRAGNLSRPGYPSMEDHTLSVLGLANGGSAFVHADYLRPDGAPTHGDDRIRVAGTSGVVEVRDERCWLITADAAPVDITDPALGVEVHLALLAAIDGDSSIFSTEASLSTARLAIEARDAISP